MLSNRCFWSTFIKCETVSGILCFEVLTSRRGRTKTSRVGRGSASSLLEAVAWSFRMLKSAPVLGQLNKVGQFQVTSTTRVSLHCLVQGEGPLMVEETFCTASVRRGSLPLVCSCRNIRTVPDRGPLNRLSQLLLFNLG